MLLEPQGLARLRNSLLHVLKVLAVDSPLFFFFFNFKTIFIYLFWLRWVFVAACRVLSLVAASRGYSLAAVLSLQRLLL